MKKNLSALQLDMTKGPFLNRLKVAFYIIFYGCFKIEAVTEGALWIEEG